MRLNASFSIRVLDVIEETVDAKSFVLGIPASLDAVFSYRPGQFVTFRILGPDGPILRCYSMASSPYSDPLPKVTVKRVGGGIGSNWICDHVKIGDLVEIFPPSGLFSPASLDVDLLLVGGGSGITPLMSILKSALLQGSGKIGLVYANRDGNSVIFDSELNALSKEFPERLLITHWLDDRQGLPTPISLGAAMKTFAHADCFICGPAQFIDVAVAAAAEAGIDPTHKHIEGFSIDEPLQSSAPKDREESTCVEVVFNGEKATLDWPRQSRLLDVLLNAGIRAPHSCRLGSCSACACRLVDGQVRLIQNNALNKADLDAGWILACQALPVTDSIKISFD